MEIAKEVLTYAGWIWTIVGFFTVFLVIFGTVKGFVPVFARLGYGLWRRKIAIVANNDAYASLDDLIRRSKLFGKDNIFRVTASQGDLESISRADIILVYWPDSSHLLQHILDQKTERMALIVYAPHAGGRISSNDMQTLESRKHVIVNNFRGRLMNDIVTSLITCGYDKG